MPAQSVKRGAIPSPRSALAAATPHAALLGAPPNFITVPAQISMWGNDAHGDCVTAEEAFAKACNQPEIFIPDSVVISWATSHGVLEGANLSEVLNWMQAGGFKVGSLTYDDGPHFSVDYTHSATLQSAISIGPVKIGVAADQLENAYWTTGGHTGWFATGFHADTNYDHCVSLCGYGTIAWLAQQLHVQVPASIDGTKQGYALFTWNSIGIIDEPSVEAITCEAWLRNPTTITTPVWAWESLGGLTPNHVSPVSWGANRLDLFVRGTDFGIYHKWWDGAHWGPSMTAWESLGGATPGPVTAVSWGRNRLDLFVRGTDNGIYHKWWDGAHWGPSMTAWESLGGATPDAIGAVSWGANRLDLFVRGTDNGIYHKWWDGAHWGPSMTAWESLGGATPGPVTAVSWGANRLDLFVRGTDNGIYHKWWDGAHWGPSMTAWESLGGATPDAVGAVSWGANRLDLFVRGIDNGIYHKWWDGAHWGP